jgi:hypothetical protein
VKSAVVNIKNVSAIDKILHVFYKNQELYQSDGVVLSNMVDKNNDNKIHHLYSANVCPEIENPDNLENNEGQTYGQLPSEANLSMDCEFLSVTSFDGTIKIIKMPAIIDPI